jgi:hypothetical protein
MCVYVCSLCERVCVCEWEWAREREMMITITYRKYSCHVNIVTYITNIDCVCETLQASLILEMCTPPYGFTFFLNSSEILVFCIWQYDTFCYTCSPLTLIHMLHLSTAFFNLILFFCRNVPTGHTLVESMLFPHLLKWNYVELAWDRRWINVCSQWGPAWMEG